MKLIAPTIALAVASVLAPAIARADDKADCIAAFDAGQAARKDGKISLAIRKFAQCARDVCPRSLQTACVEQATESTALLPSIVLSATDGARDELTAVRVSIDGVVVASTLDGKAIPIDPGLHTFRFEAAGLAPLERQLPVKEAQKGQAIAVQIGPTAAVAPVPDGARWSSTRWAGVGAGAGGVVGIVVGAVFGSLAFSQWSTAQSDAKQPGNLPAGQSAKAAGETDATVSTVAFVAGGALAAGGLVLFLASPSKSSSTSASIAPSPGGLAVLGTF